MIDCDLAFERSEVEAQITTPVISIKNPLSGHISVPAVGEVIRDLSGADGVVMVPYPGRPCGDCPDGNDPGVLRQFFAGGKRMDLQGFLDHMNSGKLVETGTPAQEWMNALLRRL